MNNLNHITKTAAALALIATAGTTQAAVITGVSIFNVSSELTSGGGGFNRNANNTIDGSGFEINGPGTHTNSQANDNDMWLSRGTFNGNDPLPGAAIFFDLGDNYDLNTMTIWNYNEFAATARGINEVIVRTTDDVNGIFSTVGNFTFNQAPGTANVDFGQTIDLSIFTRTDNVRLIWFDIQSNHNGDNNFAGLSEVRFDGVLIPEPGSLALLGLGGLLAARRRRGVCIEPHPSHDFPTGSLPDRRSN